MKNLSFHHLYIHSLICWENVLSYLGNGRVHPLPFIPEVLNKDGSVCGEKITFTKKSIPKSEIALSDVERSSAEWVDRVVEVGIRNSLLQNGHLEIVDAPGMSENEVLDKIVQDCLDGIIQVIIYVVDGNSSLRMQVGYGFRSPSFRSPCWMIDCWELQPQYSK